MNLVLANDEESSMEEINKGVSLGDDSKMGTNDTSNKTGMLVVKEEGKEYATAINTTPCGHFQNQGKKWCWNQTMKQVNSWVSVR